MPLAPVIGHMKPTRARSHLPSPLWIRKDLRQIAPILHGTRWIANHSSCRTSVRGGSSDSAKGQDEVQGARLCAKSPNPSCDSWSHLGYFPPRLSSQRLHVTGVRCSRKVPARDMSRSACRAPAASIPRASIARKASSSAFSCDDSRREDLLAYVLMVDNPWTLDH